jgi:hypothetical protein
MMPQEVSKIEMAFPADVQHLMVEPKDIPQDFNYYGGSSFFKDLAGDWFFKGIDPDILEPKEGIDKQKALNHLLCIMHSFQPKHEHKISCVAYLMSEWFDVKVKE